MEIKTKEKKSVKPGLKADNFDPKKFEGQLTVNSAWTEKEDEKLREVFPFSSDEELETVFNRSVTSIKGRAYRLGLKKHWSMVQSIHKKNAKSRWNQLREEKLAKSATIRTGKRATIKEIN